MSSYLDGGSLIAAAVILPVFGAAWLAWNAGEMIVAGVAGTADCIKDIAKRRELEKQRQEMRLKLAKNGRNEVRKICRELLAELEKVGDSVDIGMIEKTERAKIELARILEEEDEKDVGAIEMQNARRLEDICRIRSEIAKACVSRPQETLTLFGEAAADRMKDLEIAFCAAASVATDQKDVVAKDPAVLERARLQERVYGTADRIRALLERIAEVSKTALFTASEQAHIDLFFGDIGDVFEEMLSLQISNDTLRRRLSRIEHDMEIFESGYYADEHAAAERGMYYQAYREGAEALGEKVKPKSAFKSTKEIIKELEKLKARAAKAEACSEKYKLLGQHGYICAAWDTELKRAGYTALTEEEAEKVVRKDLVKKTIKGKKIPFYIWEDNTVIRMYSICEGCYLLLTVNPDGGVSTEVISDLSAEKTEKIQKKHCERMKRVYGSLWSEWFIAHTNKTTVGPERYTTLAGWYEERKRKENPQGNVTGNTNSSKKKKQEEDQE